MNTTPRFLLQDLVKQAQASAMDRARIAKEAAHQMKSAADGTCEDDPKYKKDKEKDSCCGGSKTGSAEEVTTDYAMKLASAIEFVLPHVSKLAAPQAPPPHLSETKVEPGKGPGAMHVMESAVGGTPPGPGAQGKATPKNTPPTHTGMQSTTAAGPSTQIPNDINNPPGGKGEQTTAMPSGKGKTAEAVYAKNLQVLHKMAQDTSGQRTMAAFGGEDAGHTIGTGAGLGLGGLGGAGIAGLVSKGDPGAMAAGGTIGAGLGGIVGGELGDYVGGRVAKGQFDSASPEEQAMMAGRGRGAVTGSLAGGLTGLGAGAGLGYMAGKGSGLGGVGAALGGVGGMIGGNALGHGIGGLIGKNHPVSPEDAAHLNGYEKEGSAQPTLVDVFLATIKQAEDAINPANISAGPAVEPDATQSGQGTPPTPNGSQMVGSNESAINYTKQQAKAEPKRDMSAYVSEPALASAHDNTLQQAFSHTGDAGVKMSSASAAMQVSAARALLEKIAAAANK